MKVKEILSRGFLATGAMALALGLGVAFSSANAQAASAVKINTKNFPDSVFQSYVSTNFDTNSDGKLSAKEIKNATEISIASKAVTSLTGIEYLTSLKKLDCTSNSITRLNLKKNTNLKSLSCGSNQLTSLNLSKKFLSSFLKWVIISLG